MADEKQIGPVNTKRRNFLKMAAVAAPAVAGAASLGASEAAAATEAPKSGLQDTPHTRAYFETARF